MVYPLLFLYKKFRKLDSIGGSTLNHMVRVQDIKDKVAEKASLSEAIWTLSLVLATSFEIIIDGAKSGP